MDKNDKNVRSWSKPDNIPGLIGRKKVDWSTFNYGSHIPLEFIEDFEHANAGFHLERGSSRELKLILDNKEYTARLANHNRQGFSGDTLQINWGNELKQVLVKRLQKSYDYLRNTRQQNNSDEDTANLPSEYVAYIDFFETDTPFQYRLQIVSPEPQKTIKGISNCLQSILDNYIQIRTTESFGGNNLLRNVFRELKETIETSGILDDNVEISIKWSCGQGNWAKIPWVAFLDSRETDTTQKGVYCVFLFCEDMSGVYLTLNQGVTEVISQSGVSRNNARSILRDQAINLRKEFMKLEDWGYSLDNNISLQTDGSLGKDYESGIIAYKFYKSEDLPDDQTITEDLDNLIRVYYEYVSSKKDPEPDTHKSSSLESTQDINLDELVQELITNINAQGYYFEPWQIASYVTALKTKPFIILAGVSGTGKTKLPILVSNATDGQTSLIAVKPDWTDSSDVLGYCDLQGRFRPGPLINIAREATKESEQHFTCIMDEMNLARVEHYFAEVLSQIENRYPMQGGGFASKPLLSQRLLAEDERWQKQGLPPNLAIVGTVNMDESTYGFSRKVLDRAFTIEFSEINLNSWEFTLPQTLKKSQWPLEVWYPRAISLSALNDITPEEKAEIQQVVEVLTAINRILMQAQLQVGYRTRDEIALFVLHAREMQSSFITYDGAIIDPLDLALQMKVLPRIIGGNYSTRNIILQLLGWSERGSLISESDAEELLENWINSGRPAALQKAKYPRTAARLCLMWERLVRDGFTSYWM